MSSLNPNDRVITNGSQDGVNRRQRTTAGDINEGPKPLKIGRYINRAAEGYTWDDTNTFPAYDDWASFPHRYVERYNRMGVNTIPNPSQSADQFPMTTRSVGDPL